MRKPYKNLGYRDRQIIEEMLLAGASKKDIAQKTGVALATVYREIERGRDSNGKYSAEKAQLLIFG